MKKLILVFVYVFLASLTAIAQQANVRIGSVDLTLGMTKKEVFRQFPLVFSTKKTFATADEIPDGEVIFVCSQRVSGTKTCDGGELQFLHSRLNYASKSWYSNTSAPATVAEILGAISEMSPNQKITSCTTLYRDEHTPEGIAEKVWITCGAKGVYIARWPWSVRGKAQPEAQDVSEFIGEMRSPDSH